MRLEGCDAPFRTSEPRTDVGLTGKGDLDCDSGLRLLCEGRTSPAAAERTPAARREFVFEMAEGSPTILVKSCSSPSPIA